MMDAKTAVTEIIENYFLASYEGDGALMSTAFNKDAHIYGVLENGALQDRPQADFCAMVGAGTNTAKAAGLPKDDEILSLTFTGENTCCAIVRLALRTMEYTDIISLAKIDGKWGIIAKVLAGRPRKI